MKEIQIDGDRVFLKKSYGSWRVIHPIKIDNKINWKNLVIGGSWFNLAKIAFVVGVIVFVALSYKHDMAQCIDYAIENYCYYK